MRVAIIGAGILGAASAWRIAAAGHDVTVFDPSPGMGATHGSFAWINATMPEDPAYNLLRRRAVMAWHRWKADYPDLPATFPGMLLWEQGGEALETFVGDVLAASHPVEIADRAAILARAPALVAPPENAAWLPEEGHADPGTITNWLLGQASTSGVRTVNTAVTAIETSRDRATGVTTAKGSHAADHVVVAAGIAGPELLLPLGLSVATAHSPGITVLTRPLLRQVGPMLATPDIEAVQQDDGRWRVCAHYGHDLQEIGDADAAHWALARLAETVAGTDTAEIETVTLRQRPIPADGLPVVGPVGPEGLTLVLTHSGVTLAPVIVEAVLAEIEGRPYPTWARYTPGRPALSEQPVEA